MKENTEGIELDRVAEAETPESPLRLVQTGCQTCNRTQERDPAQRALAAPFVQDPVEQHDDHPEDREHDLRQDANVIGGWGDALHSLERSHHCPTSLLAN